MMRLKLAYPIQSFAVAHPPSMRFKAERPQAFKNLGVAQGLVLEAASQLLVGNVPAFEISGSGTASPQSPAVKTVPSSAPPVAATNHGDSAQPSLGSVARLSNKEAWAAEAGLAVLCIAFIVVVWRRRNVTFENDRQRTGR